MIIKSVIDNRRANRFGKYPVKISLSDKGKRKYISLGIHADLSEFDEATGLLTSSDRKTQKQNLQDNNLILAVLTQVNDIVIEARKDNIAITPDYIVNAYKELNTAPDEEEVYTFNSYFKHIITLKKKSTAASYISTLKKIESYFRQELRFEEIDKLWLKLFIRKMRTEKIRRNGQIQIGQSINSQGIHLRNIRSVFNEAIDDKVIGQELYPFRKFEIEEEEINHRAISVEDLRKVFTFSGTASENWARDVAKLTFYLIGINTADLYKLSEMRDGYIGYRRSKTSKLYTIKLEPESIELINQFRGEKSLLVFEEQFSQSNAFSRKLNGQTHYDEEGTAKILKRGLNTIGDELGIPNLTSYVFRHTWATIAAQLEIPKETIAAALGHGKKVVTDIYINFDKKKIDEANRKVIDYVLERKPS